MIGPRSPIIANKVFAINSQPNNEEGFAWPRGTPHQAQCTIEGSYAVATKQYRAIHRQRGAAASAAPSGPRRGRGTVSTGTHGGDRENGRR
jgi:hypothetical protein